MQMSAWPFSSGPTTPSHPLKMSSETPSQTKEKQSPARWDAGPGRGNSVGLFPIKFPLRALLGWCQINPPLTRLCIKHKYSQTTGTKHAIISECARTFKSKQRFLFFEACLRCHKSEKRNTGFVCLPQRLRIELAIPPIALKRHGSHSQSTYFSLILTIFVVSGKAVKYWHGFCRKRCQ